jgi:Uncharacterized protein conserved in bacteria, COG1937
MLDERKRGCEVAISLTDRTVQRGDQGRADRSAIGGSPAFSDDVVAQVRVRLRRAGGQVTAVERMLAEGRDCTDVITQLSAAIRALEQAGFGLLAGGLGSCLEDAGDADAREAAKALFERLFLKIT